jgi:hypothetical protein
MLLCVGPRAPWLPVFESTYVAPVQRSRTQIVMYLGRVGPLTRQATVRRRIARGRHGDPLVLITFALHEYGIGR